MKTEMAKPAVAVVVEEIDHASTRDGDLVRRFRVGVNRRVVSVRVTEGITPQEAWCNCPAFKYSQDRSCKHVRAVYAANVFGGYVD